MYDLLGNWDLLVRLRIHQGIKDDDIVKIFTKSLVDSNMLDSVTKQAAKVFGRIESVNVTKERTSLPRLMSDMPLNRIPRARMKSTQDYEQHRCQRSFLYVKLPDDQPEAVKMLESLRTPFDQQTSAAQIIESVSLSKRALIFELFSRCSQSALINMLNRDIEKYLSSYRSQKYTLLAYNYDEETLACENGSM
jgi:hypothetical protein